MNKKQNQFASFLDSIHPKSNVFSHNRATSNIQNSDLMDVQVVAPGNNNGNVGKTLQYQSHYYISNPHNQQVSPQLKQNQLTKNYYQHQQQTPSKHRPQHGQYPFT
jgi:hypothetical protein